MSRTYYNADKYKNLIDILLLIGSTPKGYSAKDIGSEISIKYNTLQNILECLKLTGMIEQEGEVYYIGDNAAKLWSSRVALLKAKQNKIKQSLEYIGG